MASKDVEKGSTDKPGAMSLNVGDRTFLSLPFIEPIRRQAEKLRSSVMFHGGRHRICACKADDLDDLGPGIGLYFRMLYTLFLFFVLAVAIAGPCFALAAAGTRLSDDELDPLKIAKLSIANVGDRTSLGNYTVTVPGTGVTYSANQIAAVWTAVDFIIVVLFLVCIAAMRFIFAKRAATIESDTITVADYSVFVTGLPTDVSEEAVLNHFDGLYNLRKPDWTFRSSCKRCFCGRKMAQRAIFSTPDAANSIKIEPKYFTEVGKGLKCADDNCKPVPGNRRVLCDEDVEPVSATNDAFEGKWVADVVLARAHGHLIRHYRDQVSLFRALASTRATAQRYADRSKHSNPKKFASTLGRLEKLEKRVSDVLTRTSSSYSDDVVGAFVTFNNAESKARCLQDYGGSRYWWHAGYWGQADPLRFKGKPLSVGDAPDPSRILWENLQTTPKQRCARTTAVTLLVVLLLFVSFFFIMMAQGFQSAFRASVPNLSVCGTVLPAIAFGKQITSAGEVVGALPASLEFKRDSTDLACVAQGASRLYWNTTDAAILATNTSTTHACFDECFIASGDSRVCHYPTTSPSISISLPRDNVVACYCVSKLRHSLASNNVFAAITDTINQEKDFCAPFARDYLTFNAIVILASVIVVVVNTSLALILNKLTKFERHPDIDSEHINVAARVFVAMFLNTGCIMLLINAALPAAVSEIQVGGKSLFSGSYASFDVRWHSVVGASLVLTMIINSISVHLATATKACYTTCCLRCCNSAKATQQDLDEAYSPAVFPFPVRIAALLNSVVTCFVYACGHPIFYAVAAFSIGVSILFDRIAILRLYRKPHRFDATIPSLALAILPVATVLHLLFGLWMVSDPTTMGLYTKAFAAVDVSQVILSSAQTVDDVYGGYALSDLAKSNAGVDARRRLALENTLPLFVLTALVVLAWLLFTAFHKLSKFAAYTCGASCARCSATRPILDLPRFTGEFARPLHPSNDYKLSDEQVSGGLKIVFDAHNQFLLVWADPTTGKRLFTFQIASISALPSFHMEDNPELHDIVAAIEDSRANAKVSPQHSSSIARRNATMPAAISKKAGRLISMQALEPNVKPTVVPADPESEVTEVTTF